MNRRIVAGVDGSAHAAALRWALAAAEAQGGEVVALFAWQLPFLSMPAAFDREELEAAAKAFLVEAISAVTPKPPVPLLPLVAEGDPTEALISASADADLLVPGIRGRSPFAGLLLGSVSQGCASGAACPVLLVKPSDAARLPGAGSRPAPR